MALAVSSRAYDQFLNGAIAIKDDIHNRDVVGDANSAQEGGLQARTGKQTLRSSNGVG
jgi:hypothetical protein